MAACLIAAAITELLIQGIQFTPRYISADNRKNRLLRTNTLIELSGQDTLFFSGIPGKNHIDIRFFLHPGSLFSAYIAMIHQDICYVIFLRLTVQIFKIRSCIMNADFIQRNRSIFRKLLQRSQHRRKISFTGIHLPCIAKREHAFFMSRSDGVRRIGFIAVIERIDLLAASLVRKMLRKIIRNRSTDIRFSDTVSLNAFQEWHTKRIRRMRLNRITKIQYPFGIKHLSSIFTAKNVLHRPIGREHHIKVFSPHLIHSFFQRHNTSLDIIFIKPLIKIIGCNDSMIHLCNAFTDGLRKKRYAAFTGFR